MTNILAIALAAVLTNNVILAQFYGICPFLGVSKKVDTASGMGMAVIFVMGIASAVTWVVNNLVLIPLGLDYMRTVAFILVIATLVQFVEIALKKYVPSLYKSLGVYLPLITTNCAVLGVTINNITDQYSFLESMVSSLGCGLGFLLAMVLFAGVRSRLEESDAPECFKGIPITLIAASIVSVAFYGFGGVVEGLFA